MQIHSLAYAASPAPLFENLLDLPGAVLLQSGDRRHYQSRYDLMSAEPSHSVHYHHGKLRFGEQLVATNDPLGGLNRALERLPRPTSPVTGVPFTQGFIGLFGYPLHQNLERHHPAPPDPTSLPALVGGYYDWSLVTDHYAKTTTLYSHCGKRQTQALLARVQSASKHLPRSATSYTGALEPFAPSSSDADYASAFARIQEYILAGDCYQANLARHWQARIDPEDGWPLYQQLQQAQGGAFSAYLKHDAGCVLSLSPERLALANPRHDHTAIETCPIKGTAPRSAAPGADRWRAQQLQASIKNRAENVMIVDLLRNDLGRLARIGSVRVRQLFELVSLPNVHHLVSTISAEIGRENSNLDILRALLPGGSITGAPKLRAVDIINTVEPVGRSAYCGSLGYIDASGRMDMNITIRTLVLEPNGNLHLWGGGAIVADSDCDAEAREITHKIGRLMQVVNEGLDPNAQMPKCPNARKVS